MSDTSHPIDASQGPSDATPVRTRGGCRVCGGDLRPALTARERMIGTRETFDYLECECCGCLQIREIPADLERFYGGAYYTTRQAPGGRRRAHAWRRAGGRALSLLRLGLARRFGLRIGRRFGGFSWLARTGTGLDSSILDVGCGSGRLLQRMDRAGFTRLTGLDERLPRSLEEGAGPRLIRLSFEAYEGHHHLVMAHHSFEHVRDPRAAFAAFARLVEPGGWLLLRTPRADGEPRSRYGAHWVQLDAPRHLHLHTRASIETLAHASGFRLVAVEDDSGPFQVWGSELYRRDVALSEAGRSGRRIFGVWTRLGFRWQARVWRRAGRGDQACFYLQRDP